MAQVNPNPTLSNPSLSNPAFSAPRPKPAAKRLVPILLGAAGVVLLGGGGVLVGLNSKLTTLQTSAQQKDAEVSSSQQIARRYQATLDNYNQTQAHIQYLESSVSDRAYVPTLLAQIQALAAQTHLSVAAIRPTASAPAAPPAPAPASGDSSGGVPSAAAKKTAPPPYDTMDVAVDVAGSYADTSMFLYSLTRFPKIVSVDSVQMHPGTAPKGGLAPITTNLKLTAFMFHDADASAAPGAAPVVPTAFVPPPAAVPPAMTGAAPPAASPTVGGSVGRAATSAVSVTKTMNSRSASQLSTL